MARKENKEIPKQRYPYRPYLSSSSEAPSCLISLNSPSFCSVVPFLYFRMFPSFQTTHSPLLNLLCSFFSYQSLSAPLSDHHFMLFHSNHPHLQLLLYSTVATTAMARWSHLCHASHACNFMEAVPHFK